MIFNFVNYLELKMDKDICTICLEDIDNKNIIIYNCNHKFHIYLYSSEMNTPDILCTCAQDIKCAKLIRNNKCPMCRQVIDDSNNDLDDSSDSDESDNNHNNNLLDSDNEIIQTIGRVFQDRNMNQIVNQIQIDIERNNEDSIKVILYIILTIIVGIILVIIPHIFRY